MKRRSLLIGLGVAGTLASTGALTQTQQGYSYDRPVFHNRPLKPPASGRINVAFMISQGANVIDLAGPWEVFQDVHFQGRMPFRLYTVGPDDNAIIATGGLKIVPNYTIDNAPKPHIVSVGAQRGGAGLTKWLQAVSQQSSLTMSICTGAFQLGRAGLLDGLQATTHHDFFDDFENDNPNVTLLRGPRFVESEKIATAGGLTSGIDLALRTVTRYFDEETAMRTARYMEYTSTGWLET